MSSSNNGTNGNFLSSAASLLALTGDFTLAVWAANTLQAGVATFLSFEAGATALQFYATTGTRTPHFFSDGVDVAFPGGLYTDAAWVFYAVSHTAAAGGTSVIYRGANGAALSTSSNADGVSFTPTVALLFNENANDEPVLGKVLGLMVWSAALSAKEIGTQYLQLRPVSRVNALERWIPVVDVSNPGQAYVGRSRNFTLTGALPTSHSMPSVPWGIPMLL